MAKEEIVRCPRQNFSVDRTVGRDLWTEWAAVAESSHTWEQVQHPRYFGAFRTTRPDSPRNSDSGLRVRDRIKVAAKDGSWVGELMVRNIVAGVDEVHTKVLSYMSFEAGDLPEGYKIENRGPRGWVIYLNNVEVEPGFADPKQAADRIAYLTREKRIEARVEAIEKASKPRAAKKVEQPEATPAE